MELTTLQIAEMLGGFVEGDETIIINKLAKIEEGDDNSVTFLANLKYSPYVYTTKAAAIVCNKTFVPKEPIKATLIRVDDAYTCFAKLLGIFNKETEKNKGISWRAKVSRKTSIGKNVYIGHFVSVAKNVTIGDNVKIFPNVTIYEGVTIGNNCTIHAGSVIMDHCVLGNNCTLHANVIVGSDGFGFAPSKDGKYYKIPQTGNVVLEDDVEVGANTTLDRATMGSTYIRKGTKLDNLIQIGHNCDIGENTVVAGQTGISGSTKVGHNCMIGGQTGVAGHLKIGNNVKIAAKSGVMVDIEDGIMHMGAPSFDARQYKKSYINFVNLDKIVGRLKQVEKQLEELKKQSE